MNAICKSLLASVVLASFVMPTSALAWPSLPGSVKKLTGSSGKATGSAQDVQRERINKSPAAMEIRSLNSMTKSFRKKLQKDAKWWANVEKNQYWIKSDLKRAKKYLGQLKSKDPSYPRGDFESVMADVEKRLGGAVSAGNDKKAHTAGLRDAAMKFKGELKSMGRAFSLLQKLQANRAKPETYVKKVLAIGEQMTKLSGFFDRCKSTYNKAMVDPDAWGRTYWRAIDKSDRDLCKLDAKTAQKMLLGWVEKSVAKADTDSMKSALLYLKDLAEQGKYSEWAVKHFAQIDDEVKKDRERWLPVFTTILKRSMPAKLFTGQATYYRANYKKSLKQGLRKARFGRAPFKGSARDGRSSAASKKVFAGLGMRVLKLHQTGGWTMKKNGIGIPLYRFIGTRLLVKAKKERHCRIYEVTNTQQYAGGGRWSKQRSTNKGYQSSFWVAPCR